MSTAFFIIVRNVEAKTVMTLLRTLISERTIVVMHASHQNLTNASIFLRAFVLYLHAYVHMSEFVSDCKGGAQAVVFDDGTAAVLVAHGAQFGQAKSVAFAGRSTDVVSAKNARS